MKAYIVGETISSSAEEAFSWYEKSRWGEKRNSRVEYAGVEAMYLLENKKMKVFAGEREIGFEELMKRLSRKDKKIELKYVVFSDLRKKGYVVKTALKFGAEFRVYEKGVRPGEDHARWIVSVVKESEKINWHDFAAKNRVAHSTRKNLLVCVVDEEGGVNYYEVGWKKF